MENRLIDPVAVSKAHVGRTAGPLPSTLTWKLPGPLWKT